MIHDAEIQGKLRLVFYSYQVEREIVTKKHRRKDGTKLPAFASGLADSDLSSTGLGVLKPTPIMTPEVVQTHDNLRKSSNDSCSVEEKIPEDYNDILGNPSGENSNSATELGTVMDSGLSEVSVLSKNDSVAQSQSSMKVTNFSSSTSHNGSKNTSNGMDGTFTVDQNVQKEDTDISSSSDIFSQIGSLVRTTQSSINQQLPNLTTTEKAPNKSIPSPESTTKGSNTLKRSQEASDIISAFPLLDFMQSSHLMIPLQSQNFKMNNSIPNTDVTKDENSEPEMNIVRKDFSVS